MTRMTYPSIQDMTAQILREVNAEQQIKTAEQQLLRHALNPVVHTEIAQQLTKLASACRHLSDTPDVSYAELHQFIVQTDAK